MIFERYEIVPGPYEGKPVAHMWAQGYDRPFYFDPKTFREARKLEPEELCRRAEAEMMAARAAHEAAEAAREADRRERTIKHGDAYLELSLRRDGDLGVEVGDSGDGYGASFPPEAILRLVAQLCRRLGVDVERVVKESEPPP